MARIRRAAASRICSSGRVWSGPSKSLRDAGRGQSRLSGSILFLRTHFPPKTRRWTLQRQACVSGPAARGPGPGPKALGWKVRPGSGASGSGLGAQGSMLEAGGPWACTLHAWGSQRTRSGLAKLGRGTCLNASRCTSGRSEKQVKAICPLSCEECTPAAKCEDDDEKVCWHLCRHVFRNVERHVHRQVYRHLHRQECRLVYR